MFQQTVRDLAFSSPTKMLSRAMNTTDTKNFFDSLTSVVILCVLSAMEMVLAYSVAAVSDYRILR